MLNKTTDRLSNLKIASPCPMSWEQMKGDDRARFCEHCSLHVYNISELTKRQALALIEKTEERVCARLYRRTDGSVLTRDCPVGLRAIRRRVARIAGATATAVLSFCFGVMGQKSSQDKESCSPSLQVTVERKGGDQVPQGSPRLAGVVKDPNGAVIAGASVQVVGSDPAKTITVVTNDEGWFQISSLEPGSYTIRVVASGFNEVIIKDVAINADEILTSQVILDGIPMMGIVTIGIIGDESVTDSNIGNKTTFEPKKITRLPF
jgi:hypothetical protein